MEEAGTSGTVTAAAVAGVSGSMVKVDPAGHDREAVGSEELGRLAAAGGDPAAAQAGAAATAPVQEAADNQAELEDPADFEDPTPAAAAAGEGRRVAVLAENVGAGCKEAALEQGRVGLGTVGKGFLTVHAGPVAVKGDQVGSK